MNTEICLIFRHSLLPRTADLIHPHLKSHACNIEGPTDFRASSQKIRRSGPPKERGMTDGMAIGWPTKSRTRSQIFLHIHRAKEIRIGGEKHALSWMTGPKYEHEGNSVYIGDCANSRLGQKVTISKHKPIVKK